MSHQRGAALLIALWIMALGSLLLGKLAESVQLQQHQSQWLRQHTQAMFAAEAGLNLAVARLLSPPPQAWQPDGQVHDTRFAGNDLRIRIRSERGKLDLNAADRRDLTTLFRACRNEHDGSEKPLVQALVARQNTLPLRMVDELLTLPGMSAERYRCLLPDITVWAGVPRPDPTLVSRRLAQVLGMPYGGAPVRNAGQVLTLSIEAILPGGFSDRLDVTLVLRTGLPGRKPYRVLRWQE